jgi:maltose O-acetyltransferase
MTELAKMLAGELYDPHDAELIRRRDRARDLCQDLNATREADRDDRRRILTGLFGTGGDSVWMQPPFFCDYGVNTVPARRITLWFGWVCDEAWPADSRSAGSR